MPLALTEHNVEARRLLQSGGLGSVKMVSILMTNFTEGLYRRLPWKEAIQRAQADESSPQPYLTPGLTSYCDPSMAGGGQIYCQVSHAAAHLAFITGREPTEVFSRFDNCGSKVDIYNVLNIKLDDGAIASLASTGTTKPSERTYEVRVYGTEGRLFMDLWKGTMVLHKVDGQVHKYEELAPQDIYPLYAPATNLVDVSLGLAGNGSPATLGATAMRIIRAPCWSASCGQNAIL